MISNIREAVLMGKAGIVISIILFEGANLRK